MSYIIYNLEDIVDKYVYNIKQIDLLYLKCRRIILFTLSYYYIKS